MNIIRNLWAKIILWTANFVAIDRAKFMFDKFARFLNPEGSVLDLGCGTGHIGLQIFNSNYGAYELHFLDIQPKGLDLGQRLVATPCASQIAKLCQGNFSLYAGGVIPEKNERFDNVLIAFVLHHCKNPEQTLQEALRVTKKGGRIIILEDIPLSEKEAKQNKFFDALVNLEFFGHPHENRTREEWENLFSKYGLKEITYDHWVSYLYKMPFPNAMFILEKK